MPKLSKVTRKTLRARITRVLDEQRVLNTIQPDQKEAALMGLLKAQSSLLSYIVLVLYEIDGEEEA